MRSSLIVLALGLGLFALAQAAELQSSVLLKGLTPDDDVTALHGHHHRHWHRHGPPHDPHDAPYWEKRHSVKADLIRCLERAAESFDKDNSATWPIAGKAAAQCFLEHLGGCHDAPGIAEDVRKTLPWLMFVNGLETLADPALDNTGLLHATTVFNFYLAGSVESVNGVPNPFYVPGGCAAKLTTLLQSACHKLEKTEAIWAIARLIAKLIESADQGWGEFAPCVPDIPAVIISLVSTQCPSRKYLYNPLTDTRIPCVPSTKTYEDGAGALLGGSIYTALLLSGNEKLITLGAQVGFAINRMALAATQTTSFATCLDSNPLAPVPFPGGIDYNGELKTALDDIPVYSGAVPTPKPTPTNGQAYTPLPLGPDGQRVICASIAMMSGDSFGADADPTYRWENNLLWQGSANTANAIFKTIAFNQGAVTIDQVKGLCVVGRALWRFTTTTPPTATAVTIPGFVAAAGEQDFSCVSNFNPNTCLLSSGLPGSLPFRFTKKPFLAAGHTLMSTTPDLGGGFIGPVCWP